MVASDFSFTACSMQGSVSNYGGGAILVESSNLLVAQSQIADSVGEAGAAIHSIGSMLTMKYSSFDRNGLVTYNAGAIYVSATSKLVSFATNYTSNQVMSP